MRQFLFLFLLFLYCGVALGQPAPAQPVAGTGDEINQQAAKLESELAKLKDSAPEAAPLMAELIDLYHKNARVFGLISVGERFINSHPQHVGTHDVMLKLLDGLLTTSRNKEVASTARQFLSRFPMDPEAPRIEIVLAKVLDQLEDRPRQADALAVVWTRQGDTVLGRQSLARAMQLYSGLNTREGITRAAELAEEALNKLPAGTAVDQLAMHGVQEWRRISEWNKSNVLAGKLIAKGVPGDAKAKRQLFVLMGENFANQNQRQNAAEHYKKARAVEDSYDILARVITELHNASAPVAEIEPLVNEFFQKFAERPERFGLRNFVALACLRAMDKGRAVQIFGELLPFEASYASTYVQNIGPEPPQFAQAEQTLIAAIPKNTLQAGYLRFVLAFEIYRDRLKDLAKTKQTLRELLQQSPTNDGYTQQAIYWLLYNAADDAEFQADLQIVLKVRNDNLPLTNIRPWVTGWVTEASSNKDHKPRADMAKAKIDEANAQSVYKDWLIGEENSKAGQEARARLLAPDLVKTFNDLQARALYYAQAGSYYGSGDPLQRAASAMIYEQMAARFPTDRVVAYNWLVAATNYGTPENCRAAVLGNVQSEPEVNNHSGNHWYYLMVAADRTNDAALVRQVYDWLMKSQQKFGLDAGYGYHIGDVLEKHKFVAEAMEYWKSHYPLNREGYESRYAADRIATRLKDAERTAFLQELLKTPTYWSPIHAYALADDALKANNLPLFEQTLRAVIPLRHERPLTGTALDEYPPQTWVDQARANKELPLPAKIQIFTVVRDLKIGRPSAAATLALMEYAPPADLTPMQRLLAWQDVTAQVGNDSNDWDRLMPYAQAALTQKDYLGAASLLTGMLANIPQVDPGRKQAARDLVTQSYTRIGGVGLTIDETSPIAPLLQAALYLRLGDERLAFETYLANQKLFDEHRTEVPSDLLLFICESHLAAGGDVNLNRVEDILTSWLIKFAEAKEIDDTIKASVRLLLAKNFYKGQRYDVARSEFTTIINLYPGTKQAVEAEFGIGEAFMAQKVYDQAEQVFEKLAVNRDRDVVIRAEFLRGVLAHRRGDLDEARDIFRGVLDRVPNIELANQTLFNLSEVYGAEQRYLDQLELLRTIGRLGRASKRFHAPGEPLSIVVQDSDLGISRGHSRIPVRVKTDPGGDEETIYLYSGGAGKGLFRADLDTGLGQAKANDKVLQLSGQDVIRCDYPPEFKADFKHVPLSDVEIRVASNGKFEASSGKIVDRDKENLSDRLEREAREAQAADQRRSQGRPINQIKPGNQVYLRVTDADRDLTSQPDQVTVKLTAGSGDQIQIALKETGAHTGMFEAAAPTSDLPAGALASDTAIEHSPLMAIDQNPETSWLSEPDGATPKWLSVDMKDVRETARVSISAPSPALRAPIRGELLGSNDGKFFFRLAAQPAVAEAKPVASEKPEMTQRVYAGDFTGLTTWDDIVNITKNRQPVEQGPAGHLSFKKPEETNESKLPFCVVWSGKFVQQRSGALRIYVQGSRTALAIDGRLELPPGPTQTIDLYLEAGTHDLAIFSAGTQGVQELTALVARAEQMRYGLGYIPFREADFDLVETAPLPARVRAPGQVTIADGTWHFQFAPIELRHVKFVIHEYLGEAVEVNHVEIGGIDQDEIHIPTKSDVLSLATNSVLEIAAGDTITAAYSDEFTQNAAGGNQLLTTQLTATYFDALVTPIAYDFDRLPNGQVYTVRKQLMRIEPGERAILEIIDYDMDRTDQADTLTIQVAVNDGEPVELNAIETEPFSGIFTKEIDTVAIGGDGKAGKGTPAGALAVKPGDRLYCTYIDTQNTFPGHAAPREAVVYINQPTDARIRIVESRVVRLPADSRQPAETVYLPSTAGDKRQAANVAFEAPLTVEVIDRDAARDSRSTVVVALTTTDGSKIDVECVISDQASGVPRTAFSETQALEDGRFVGQVVLQLGSKSSPDIVPLSMNMPRNLIGRGLIPEKKGAKPTGELLVTRVLNLTGKDKIQAIYSDRLRSRGPAKALQAEGRLIANGTLAATDRDYDKVATQLHVGEKLFLRVVDADLDTSDQRDGALVEILTDRGDKESVTLEETLIHSGVFTGSVTLKPSDKPKPGDINPNDPAIESYFGDTVHLKYVDKAASTESGTLDMTVDLPVVIGTDGLVYAFSKTFNDEKLAVETKFHIAESYFELFKSHKTLARMEEQKEDLQAGRRMLKEVMEDYPSPKYVPRIAYLNGQFAQELKQYEEAIESYRLIVRQYADHPLAPDAQYKMAQAYEEASRFDDALEAYVTLAATYPKSPLIAQVMIRINDHFYRNKNYDIAAQVGEKFLERFESHQYAPRMAFRVGQCYYKAEQYMKAGAAFDKFAKVFPEDQLTPDSMFWSGESFRMGKNDREAFRRYNKCRWEHPASEAAKYARGRLALPNMLTQFEAEATSVEEPQN